MGSDVERRARLLAVVSSAAHGGADFVQVRERDLDAASLVKLVRGCLDAVAGTEGRVLVNDRIDVALATNAGGIHLRSDSIPPRRARVLLGVSRIVGQSFHSVGEIRAASLETELDFLLFGTIFPSASKADGHMTVGLESLGEAARSTSQPVLAIGGITLEKVPAVARAGAAGFAGIGFFQACDPVELGPRISAARHEFDTPGRPSYH
jgi:thiamine-phosphate pyrophosphorylase